MLPESDQGLLEECDVEAFRASGKGGQHVNKTSTAVRLRHRPTGITVTCQEERSQHRNRQNCLRKLREKVARLNYRAPKRVRTKKPAAVRRKERRLKAEQSEKKKRRRAGPDSL